MRYCQARGIRVQAWSPIGRSRVLEDPLILKLAAKYRVSPARICLRYAVEAANRGGNACAVLNGANEAAVGLFLRDEIGFNDIPRRVRRAMDRVAFVEKPTLEEILQADQAARSAVLSGE